MAQSFTISIGETKTVTATLLDASGNPLGSCIVQGFTNIDDAFQGQCTSDTAGYYEFCTARTDAHYLVCYKAGAPDVAGTSVNTLIPV